MIEIIVQNFQSPPALFGALPRGAVSERRLQKDDALFRQGEAPFAIFFLYEGAVSLNRHTAAGRKFPLFRAVAGGTLAEASLFSNYTPAPELT